jgi:hypothetical protein
MIDNINLIDAEVQKGSNLIILWKDLINECFDELMSNATYIKARQIALSPAAEKLFIKRYEYDFHKLGYKIYSREELRKIGIQLDGNEGGWEYIIVPITMIVDKNINPEILYRIQIKLRAENLHFTTTRRPNTGKNTKSGGSGQVPYKVSEFDAVVFIRNSRNFDPIASNCKFLAIPSECLRDGNTEFCVKRINKSIENEWKEKSVIDIIVNAIKEKYGN